MHNHPLEAPQALESVALLRRIAAVLERDKRDHSVEIACAIMLSLATTASAWCAFQASIWDGVQIEELAEAARFDREASELAIESLQCRAFDGSMLISYVEASTQGQSKLARILLDRFRPPMRVAVQAWLETNPFEDPSAPSSPFQMREYTLAEQARAREAKNQAQVHEQAARLANDASDRYVLLTVIFASVLFLAGITGTIRAFRVRIGITGMAAIVLVASVLALTLLPMRLH